MESLLSSILPHYGYGEPIARVVDDAFSDCFDLALVSSRKAITVELRDGTKLQLFVKVCEKGSIAAQLDDVLMIYKKEIGFYSLILPRIASFVERRSTFSGADNVRSLFPCFYGAGMIDGNKNIFLENIKATGFRETSRESFHSEEMIRTSLKALARFHASSYCMEQLKAVNWMEEFSDILSDIMTLPSTRRTMVPLYSVVYKQNMHLLKCVLSEIQNGNLFLADTAVSGVSLPCSVLEQLEQYASSVLKIMHEVQKPLPPFCLVTHGDFHMWNIAFRGNGNGFADSKYEVKFFDFQVVRYSSPLIDIHHYLSQVSTAQMRDDSLSSFLNEYRSEFLHTADMLGCVLGTDVNNYFSLEGLYSEYKRTSPWGFLHGLCWVLQRFFQENVDLSSFLEMNGGDEMIELIGQRGGPDVWRGFRIVFDLIIEHQQLGTFDLMDKINNHSL